MPDANTSEIQNRITGLKAELDQLSFQLEFVQRSEAAPEALPEAAVVETETTGGVVAPAERQQSLRTLRDLMWQGRWGLAFHLARALETQAVGEIDFRSSTIRTWALAQDGRRNDAESLQLAEELRNGSDSAEDKSVATRLLEWATRIRLACGVDVSHVGLLTERFSPPEELPAACAWWQDYVVALGSAPRNDGKWMTLPDPQKAVREVDELMLRGELEPTRLAASCLMMSIRRAMRHVHVRATAEERFVLNAELARATTLRFAENGEVSADAGEVERAVCEVANGLNREHAVMMTEDVRAHFGEVVLPETERVNADQGLEAPTPRAQATRSRIEAVQQSLETAVLEEPVVRSTAALPVQELQQSTARERLERYAQRVAVQDATRVVVPNQLVAVAKEDGPVVTPTVASAVEPATVLPFPNQTNRVEEKPAAQTAALNGRVRVDVQVPSAAAERDDRRGIHEASLATAFSAEGQRAVNSNVRPADGTTPWAMLFNPQAAIVAALLVIAGAVIVGLGTGLAAKDLVNTSAPQNEGTDTTEEFAGDFPAME